MSNEIDLFLQQSGWTVYVVLKNKSGQFWNTSSLAFETFNASNWTDYDISLTEQGSSGIYLGNFPSDISSAGTYNYYAYRQLGGSPAQSDARCGSGTIDWTGTAAVGAATGSMTGSDFRDYVVNGGGFKRTDKDTELYEAVTDTIQDLRARFSFQEAQAESVATDAVSVDGEYKMDLESDYGLLLGIVIEDGTDAWNLTQVSKKKFDGLYPDQNVTADRGIPLHFTIYGDQILVGPIPDKTTYVYRLSYSLRAGTVSSSTTAVPFTNVYREMLRYGVLKRLYEGLDEFEKAQYFEAKYEESIYKATHREEVNTGDHAFTVQPDDTYT